MTDKKFLTDKKKRSSISTKKVSLIVLDEGGNDVQNTRIKRERGLFKNVGESDELSDDYYSN